MKTYIEQYYDEISKGNIIACHRIKQVYKMLVDKLYNRKGNWVFCEELANRPIEFIETFCKQSQGELGKNIELKLFQKAKHQAVFGFIDESKLDTDVVALLDTANTDTTKLRDKLTKITFCK